MASVIVINPFEVPKGKEEQALAMWDQFAEYFRRQPGYVSSKLHRTVNPEARFHLVTVANGRHRTILWLHCNSQNITRFSKQQRIILRIIQDCTR